LQALFALLIGLIFGLGVLIAGMSNPAKVLNFFDFAGNWDASLGFVMGGALIVTAIGYRIVFSRARPLLAPRFHPGLIGTRYYQAHRQRQEAAAMRPTS
jgi:uncharacterized protein